MKKLIIFTILLLILPIAFADNKLLCLNRGERVEFSKCNPHIPDRTCDSDTGCQFCTDMIADGVYCPASINKCNSLGLSCSSLNNASIDRNPPQIILNKPTNGNTYNSRLIDIDMRVNELSNLFYIDNINGRGRWTRLCTNCLEYIGRRNFDEGQNSITFKASDSIGNTAFTNISFFVDSKKPKILKIDPKNGFASGNFIVQFKEENPEVLTLHYGNPVSGYLDRNIELNNECSMINDKTTCNVNLNLDAFDNQFIEYWFYLEDVAESFVESKHASLDVDTTSPVFDSFNYLTRGRNVNFNISITELNFDSIDYYDYSELIPRWKTLCSRLKNNLCTARKSFITGPHNLDIKVTDDAGNVAIQNISFIIS